MPHTDVIPTSASTVSTGFGVRYIGNWAYAYSGAVNVKQPASDMLNFTSGTGLIKTKIQFGRADGTGDDIFFLVAFNDIDIIGYTSDELRKLDWPPINILIPPLTKVIVTGYNNTQDVARSCFCILSGRVYGAE